MNAVLAISDLHVGHTGNREVIEQLHPAGPEDWLIVAGDVAEKLPDIRWVLEELRSRFAKVIWVPGNHELWATARDPLRMRGEGRYQRLIELCRSLDVLTPEDPYPTWQGEDGPVMLVPMFLLYDYTFLPRGARDKAAGLALAQARRAAATDEYLLAHEPYASREQWCRERVALTRTRLDALAPDTSLVLINHFPLLRESTRALYPPEFALWCGTELTADWHRRYNVVCAVYGHLHLRGTSYHDGVRFEEVSLGYPREWRRGGLPQPLLRQILPSPVRRQQPLGEVRGAIAWSLRAASLLTRRQTRKSNG